MRQPDRLKGFDAVQHHRQRIGRLMHMVMRVMGMPTLHPVVIIMAMAMVV